MISHDPAGFSLSIFVLEADRKPVLAILAKTHSHAEEFCADERVRAALREASLCDDYSILRVRLARRDERARYHEQIEGRPLIGGLHAVFLAETNADRPADDRQAPR
jgi:hypothetical protein